MDPQYEEELCNLTEIYKIIPNYDIDFQRNIFKASCIYDSVFFQCTLTYDDMRHIDTDYLFFDTAILLTRKLNYQVENFIRVRTDSIISDLLLEYRIENGIN